VSLQMLSMDKRCCRIWAA